MSARQVYYEDIKEGMELTPVVRAPSRVQLFLFSAITRNPHRIHYDRGYALTEEHPDVLVHGPLQGALLCRFVTDWMGDDGFLKRFTYSNRGRAVPDEPLTYRGRVARKFAENGRQAVELEVWEENGDGEVLVPGRAVVYLPSRG